MSRKKKGAYYDENGDFHPAEKKGLSLKGTLIVLFVIFVLPTLVMFASAVRAMNWDTKTIGQEDRAAVAEREFLMPGIADFVETRSARGWRDGEYLYATVWFDSLGDMLAALPFPNDDLREESRREIENIFSGGESPVYHSEPSSALKLEKLFDYEYACTVNAELIPFGSSELHGENWSSFAWYNYYLLEDSSGRFKLLCVRSEM